MSGRRYRSTVACHSCRSRKVRCSINVTGVPCIRCAQDHAECVVDAPSAATRTSRRNGSLRQALRTATSSPPSRIDPYVGANTAAADCPTTRTPPVLQSRSTGSPAVPGSGEQYNIQDEERNALEIAEAALGNPERAGQVPFYTGDQTGITSTLSLSSGESLARHFLIPSRVPRALSEDDKNYLASKGVFNLPSVEACECLLQAYFSHAHTIVPIIEADKILRFFQAGRLREYNLLLVWSVFFVAFIPSTICEREGYDSRKAMKAAMYSRAKCLYNNSGERDKTVLLQSSLMLGFWHSEVDEHAQPWYWTGVSISLCQILGLHRNPDGARYNAAITEQQRHLWRRLWWTCFLRDRWLSLTLGRPLRIDLDDCDVAMPAVADILYDFKNVPQSFFTAFVPDDLPLLAEYWILLIQLSRLLGSVLTLSYKTLRPKPSRQQIEALEAEILLYKPPEQCPSWNGSTRFYLHHLQLHYEAILIVLYRPCLTESPNDLSPSNQVQWHESIRTKADAAASRTNDVLEILAEENLLEYALPMTPPLLIPAMQIHLLNCRSGNPLSRRLRLNKLNTCMMVMEEFQKVYTVASIYRGIFAKAIQQICPEGVIDESARRYSAPDPGTAPASALVPASGPGPEPASAPDQAQAQAQVGLPPVTNPIDIGDLDPGVDVTGMVDALLDESSSLSFWETWNHMWVE
ncbi:fungal-specific transcription factor domain-containing protein [Aspergillus varians]